MLFFHESDNPVLVAVITCSRSTVSREAQVVGKRRRSRQGSHLAVSVLILVVLFVPAAFCGSQESSLRLIVGQILARTLPFLDKRLFGVSVDRWLGPLPMLILFCAPSMSHSTASWTLGQPDADGDRRSWGRRGYGSASISTMDGQRFSCGSACRD